MTETPVQDALTALLSTLEAVQDKPRAIQRLLVLGAARRLKREIGGMAVVLWLPGVKVTVETL